MSTPREVLAERKRYQEWYENYRPIKNSADSSESFEVTDENRKKLDEVEPKKIWSVVHGDDGTILLSGFWDHDEVLNWKVTERSWSGEPASFSIDLAVRVWCKPCDSSGETKSGKLCQKCDGDGYKIYDVD